MYSNYIPLWITVSFLASLQKVESATCTKGTAAASCTINAGLQAATATVITTAEGTVNYYCAHTNSWLVNTISDVSPHLSTGVTSFSYPSTASKGSCINTDISSASGVTSTTAVSLIKPPGNQYYKFSGGGIPKYSYTMTTATLATLNSRPNAEYDFTCGQSTAVVGQTYQFGESIGYGCGDNCICVASSDYSVTSDSSSCATGSNSLSICPTLGWLPPGPGCPTKQTITDRQITLNPLPETGALGCYLAMGAVGYFVNGVPFYAPSDGFSYKNKGLWMQTALGFESYDVDVCYGHPAMGQYHHHCWSPCLSTRLNDAGTGHSPIYGFAMDGFPFYGPYHSNGQLSTSCFKKRDYTGAKNAAGGWGCASSTGERTCQLNSVLNPTTITDLTSANYGPSISTKVNTQSGNTITAVSGVYYEDYYFDSSCYKTDGTADYTLDVHNGHDHDSLGYHYHLTIDSNLAPTFPFGPGPQYFGCVADGTNGYCKTTFGGSTNGVSTCGSSGSDAWNFGKTSYSSTICTGSTPTMAPSMSSQLTCSVESTEMYTSASECPTTTTTTTTTTSSPIDNALIIGLCAGLGAPFLALAGYFVYTKSATSSGVLKAVSGRNKVGITNEKTVEML